MDIGEVMRGLATAAATLTGVTTYDFFPFSITEPAFVITNVERPFDESYNRGLDRLQVTCGLLVSKTNDAESARSLYAYLAGSGPRSVKEALEADPTLDGACNDLNVTVGRVPRIIPIGTTEYFGAEFTIDIDGDGE